MADIMDYLDWRGDLSLENSPFNEVDHLILSQLAYVNFDGIVPGVMYEEEFVTLEKACELFYKMYDEKEVLKNKAFSRLAPIMMKKMAQTRRFKEIKLKCYVSQLDYEAQKQFSVVQILLEDQTVYVAFRGTDDTLIGWKEDFNMSFMTAVPAQLAAVAYVNQTLKNTSCKIRMGGHSKGGNLAIYAAIKCEREIKERILEVYNNDGPGFNKEMMMSEAYQSMLSRIRTIIPQGSIIGMLLEHEEEYSVVKSKQVGIMQHDVMSWEILGTNFIYSDQISKGSMILDQALKGWVNELKEEERSEFIDTLFTIFEATGAKTISELNKAKLKKINIILKSYNAMDETSKEMIGRIVGLLTNEYFKVVKGSIGKKAAEIRSST